jgi:hypothetical protein
MKRVQRALLGLVATIALAMAMSSTALAATSTTTHPVPAAATQSVLPAHHGPAQYGSTLLFAGAPQGCPYTDFCVYYYGGGGDLLVATGGDCPYMCGHENQDGAVYNHGDVEYYDVVAMNWGTNYTYAWTCIAQGNYWLYTSHYYFNHGTAPDGNYNLQYNVASSHWQHNDCGNSGG